MYFIIRKNEDNRFAGMTPRERHIAIEAHDKAESLSLREAAAERRRHFKPKRLADLAAEKGIERGVQLSRDERIKMRAIKDSMNRRINK